MKNNRAVVTKKSTTQNNRTKETYIPKKLPDEGFVRLPSVLAVLGISRSCFLDGVKSGKYPEGKLLSPRCRVWPVSSIRELLSSIQNDEIAA